MGASAAPHVSMNMPRALLSLLLLLSLTSCSGSPTDPFGDRLSSAKLSGVITSSRNGYALAGLRLGLWSAAGELGGAGESDNYGRYSITGIRPGRYSLIVQYGPTGPQLLTTEIDVHQGANPFDFTVDW